MDRKSRAVEARPVRVMGGSNHTRHEGLVAPRIVRRFVYRDGEIRQEDDQIADGATAALTWLDMQHPTVADIDVLQRSFACHPLIVDDIRHSLQRPKVSEYEGLLLIVFYAATIVGGRVFLRELRILTGPNYLVTIHEQEMPEIDEAIQRWKRNESIIGSSGIGVMLYSLLDTIVDGYFPVLDVLAEQIERIESAVFRGRAMRDLHISLAVRIDLQRLRRFAGPCRDVLLQIIRHEAPAFGAQTSIFFQDVYDHMQRVLDSIDAQRDLIVTIADVSLTIVSNNLNDVMKRMTAYATILMLVTLITGIYGMNFENLPLLHEPWGASVVFGVMVGVAAGVFFWFRKVEWL
ncbi:MAG: magnesium transport protein CorA [Dehalococcoidia bacterium]|nr:MAG: magnesium transport protein CorA [Dehalococcoidia bacterium]